MPDRKIWVLIIDDNLVVRKTTGKLLRKEGFEILLTENGQEAMEFIDLCTPDCIILDVLMPKVHGQGFLSWLRKKNRTLPVIVVSGIDRQPALVAAMEKLGIAGWVSKPGNPKKLAKMIRKAVEPEQEAANTDLETAIPDNVQLKGKAKKEQKNKPGPDR